MGRRFVELALQAEDAPQVVVRLGQIRPQSDRLLKPCRGLVELALLPEDVAQVVVRLEEAGLESHRSLVLGRRFVELALVQQHVAQIVVHLGDVGPQRKNLAISRGSLGQPPGTMFALCQGNESIQLGWLSGRLAGRRHQVLSSLAAGYSDQL